MSQKAESLRGLRILVCGGRWYGFSSRKSADPEQGPREEAFLYKVLTKLAPTEVIAGDARGADELALSWAKGYRVPWQRYVAEWDKYGPAAGPIRNQKMHDETKPDMVVAFRGNKGTESMCGIAKAAGTKLIRPVPEKGAVIGEGFTKITPFVRKLIVDVYAINGHHSETSYKIFGSLVPEELQDECDLARQAFLERPEEPEPLVADPAKEHLHLYECLLQARKEHRKAVRINTNRRLGKTERDDSKFPSLLEELFEQALDRYWQAMTKEEQKEFKTLHPAEHT